MIFPGVLRDGFGPEDRFVRNPSIVIVKDDSTIAFFLLPFLVLFSPRKIGSCLPSNHMILCTRMSFVFMHEFIALYERIDEIY